MPLPGKFNVTKYMIRCMIIEDEPLARQVLQGYVSRMPSLVLAAVYATGIEAFEALGKQQTDLLLLDIQMPKLNGLELLRSLENPPAVIFTTAFPEHAVTGFELDAVDYLLKPFTFERFEKSVSKLMRLQAPETVVKNEFTYFKVSGELVKVLHEELLYAHCVKDYIYLYTTRGTYMTHMTMKYLAGLLPGVGFLRVHRSYLVNRSFVDRVDRFVVSVRGEQIPVGENYRQVVRSIFSHDRRAGG
jgi:DNA-binding LytR/AlgR family response regulator